MVEFCNEEDDLGLSIDLISGQEEARRIYSVCCRGWNSTAHIIIDIGGGSTELVLGDSHEPRSLSSTKVGAVRLTANISPPTQSATPSFST